MNIGIIGAAEMGSTIASKLVKAGHAVSIANSRGPASLKQLAEEIGAIAVSVEDVMKNNEVIIVSIPVKNVLLLPKNLFKQLPEHVVVIDTGNYYPNLRDGAITALDKIGIDSLWVQQELGRPVVKVFNSILATSLKNLGKPKGNKYRVALAVSGDDSKAKQIAFRLVGEPGFDPFDIGTIAQSWKQQPGSSVYCRDINIDELKKRVEKMVTEWFEMRSIIIGQRDKDEILMKENYSAYLQKLKNR